MCPQTRAPPPSQPLLLPLPLPPQQLLESAVSFGDATLLCLCIYLSCPPELNTTAAETKRRRSLIRNVSPDSPRLGETFNNIINHFPNLQSEGPPPQWQGSGTGRQDCPQAPLIASMESGL